MAKYTIRFTQSSRKELEAIEKSVVQRVFPKIEMLATEPRPSKCKKLHGEENLWRIRVGDYRVIYVIYDTDRTLDIIAIRHRSEAYR